jgi:O-antigen/teichoic acid export membrane protein
LQANYDFPIEFIFLIPLVTFLTYINEQLIVLLRSSQELKKYVITGIVRIVLEFGLSVVLVVFVAMHWKGRLTGILAANLVLGLYAFYYFREKGYLSGTFNPKYVKSELLYAIPVAAMQLSIFALSSSDKFILAKLADSNEVVGIYSVACIFASVITIFSSAYLSYLFPSIYKILSERPVNTHFIKRSFFQFLMVMVGVTLLLMVSVPFIYRNFINERYHSAIHYYYFIILGYFTWGITFFFYSFLLYHKHKRKILLLSFLSIASTLTCTYFMTKAYGPQGSAMAMFFNSTIMLIMTLVMVRKHIHKVFFEKPAAA